MGNNIYREKSLISSAFIIEDLNVLRFYVID